VNLRLTDQPNRSRNIRLATFASALIFLSSASGATYYVGTNGSDSNPGTSSAPFRHLSKGASVARAGDTVIVMDGTYDNEGVVSPGYVVTLYYSGTPGNPITFRAQNRGKAILDAMNTSTTASCNGAYSYFNLYNASYIVIQGFVIQRGCNEGIHSNDSAHDITVRWNEIRNIANHTATDQIGRDGIYINSSQYNFTFDGNVWHDIGRTDGISPLHFDHGIYSHGQNMTIVNNVFYNMNRGWSIQLADGASNWLVANNTFAFGNANGEEGQIMFWGNNPNITLQNNIYYYPNGNALTRYQANTSGAQFDHNIVFPGNGIISDASGFTIASNQTGSGANPNFMNAGGYDFRLQSGSVGVDMGLNLSSVSVDLEGMTRPQGSSTDAGAYELAAASGPTIAPPVISGVFSTGISSSSAIINWSTNTPATSYVQYGTSSYTNTTAEDSLLTTIHSVTLSGLSPSTLYHYRAGSHDSLGQLTLSPDLTFTTAAAPVTVSTISLSASSSSISAAQGSSVSDTFTATLTSASAVNVSYSASLPAGVSASFSNPTCTVTCSTTLTLSASASAAPGTYSIVVSAGGSGASASATIALTVTGTTSSSGDTSSGLMSQWKLNENGGSLAYDSSGNVNTATLYNPTWWTSDYGPTVWFSGPGSFAAVNEAASLEQTNQLTVSFWLRPSANSNLDPRVIAKLYDWDVKLNGSNRYPQFTAAAGQYAILNYSLPLITWHHVAFTFSSGTVKGYVDGTPVSFLENTFTGTESLAQWAYGLYLATDASQTNSYIGSLNDVRVYNRALSDADVAALYAAPPSSTTTLAGGTCNSKKRCR